ncbi:hypothetical protein JRO89_XS03G0297200 [Xanthoceras sorbifolium]|uniref:RNase H type-1 domain-containing protein n=1 Tax=Xanthoceras sorbifolium TaxID=99658 RepID=A0ABQ8ICQ5_9ROSI|nr:hypothetical protein JRO89_XS03G0297200 [Xanthoceras sorbifolium]
MSLLWSRELVIQGSRKRVDSGNSILIYKDRWILHPSTFSVISQPAVSDIILVGCRLCDGRLKTPIHEISCRNFELFCVILWRIWFRHNCVLHDGPLLGVEESARLKWQPPSAGVVKLNVDVALCATSGLVGIGLVLRDEEGQMLGSS